MVSGPVSWNLQPDGSTELRVQTGPKPPRVVPQNVGTDLKVNELGDLVVEDGDLALVSGKDAAIQILSNALGTTRGEIIRQPLAGSLFSKYFWDFHDKAVYLNRLLRLEIARLLVMPIFDNYKGADRAQLDFVNRVLAAEVLSTEFNGYNRIPTRLSVEFADGLPWTGEILVYVHSED